MGGAFSKHRKHKNFREKVDHLEGHGRILQWILKEPNERLIIEFIWLRILTRGRHSGMINCRVSLNSVCQLPGRGPVPGPGINYTGPRKVLLEFVILFF